MRQVLVTGGAGFIGSNLVAALQERFPEAYIVVVDDFRSGDFRNLQGFRGDLVVADISRLDWTAQFRENAFDAIFHLASITDTTIQDQHLQAHDNIEGFRKLLEFALVNQTRVIYASSAATYGLAEGPMREDQPPRPANIYAFTKVQLDNMARYYSRRHSSWKIVGLRYFNVYGPGEAHKKHSASMVYQLYRQMKDGKRPRVFRAGEQKRDFVYIRDVVDMTLQALSAPRSIICNCGSGRAFSFNSVIAELNRNLGTNLEPEYFENPYDFFQRHTEADMTLAKAELKFEPKFDARWGIATYVAALEGKQQQPV